MLLCLPCDHGGRLCKYFLFASWHDIKSYRLEGLVRHWRRKGFFPLPGSSGPCWSCRVHCVQCSSPAGAVSLSLLRGVAFSRLQPLQSTVSPVLAPALGGFSRSWSLQHEETCRTQWLAALPIASPSTFRRECCWWGTSPWMTSLSISYVTSYQVSNHITSLRMAFLSLRGQSSSNAHRRLFSWFPTIQRSLACPFQRGLHLSPGQAGVGWLTLLLPYLW